MSWSFDETLKNVELTRSIHIEKSLGFVLVAEFLKKF
jgi:hypothetical protein